MPPEPAPTSSIASCMACAHHRVLAHAEIIVGAPHRHVAGAAFGEMIGGWVGPAAALQVGEDAIAAFLVQRLKVLAETELVIHLCLDHLNLGRPLPRPGDTRISLSERQAQALNSAFLPTNAPSRGAFKGLVSINRNTVTSAASPWCCGTFCRIFGLGPGQLSLASA